MPCLDVGSLLLGWACSQDLWKTLWKTSVRDAFRPEFLDCSAVCTILVRRAASGQPQHYSEISSTPGVELAAGAKLHTRAENFPPFSPLRFLRLFLRYLPFC